MMRSVHVIPRIGAEASGPTYTVPATCRALARAGVETALHILREPGITPPTGDGYEIIAHDAWSRFYRMGFSEPMRHALIEEARRSEIMHNHSLWMAPNLYPYFATRGTKCRLVSSAHGTLSKTALARSKWKKRLVWYAGQGAMLHSVAMFKSTSQKEANSIRALGLKAPIAIIEHGIDLPDLTALGPKPTDGPRRLLFLSRIHPTKGVDTLLRAWAKVERERPDWILTVAGPDEGGILESMKQLTVDLGLKRVDFPGGVFGDAKRRLYRQSDLFVLPTLTENFGMVVAESLACGTPTVVSTGAPWKPLVEHGCGWWYELGEETLVQTLLEATSVSRADLAAMGDRGRTWMSDHNWDRIGVALKQSYEWLLGGGPAPSWIRLD